MGLDFATAGIFTEHFELKVIPGILLTFLVLYALNKTVFTEKGLQTVEVVAQTFRTVEEKLLQHRAPQRDYDNCVLQHLRFLQRGDRTKRVLRRASDRINDLYDTATCGHFSVGGMSSEIGLMLLGYTQEEVVGKCKTVSVASTRKVGV